MTSPVIVVPVIPRDHGPVPDWLPWVLWPVIGVAVAGVLCVVILMIWGRL